jgi:hypothetical protein
VNHIGYSFVSQHIKGIDSMRNADLPAMPFVENNGYVWTGLTKREHFAGLAMNGMLSSGLSPIDEDMSRAAWAAADYMLNAQEQEPTQ